MTSSHNPVDLPDGLPVPHDDGACDHLPGAGFPALALPGTGGGAHDLRAESQGRWVVLFCYPRTGRPGEEPLGGAEAWNATPGARGCTPQCLSYGRVFAELESLGARLYGVSTQTTQEQTEAVERLGLPYELLSDSGSALAEALRLPVFTAAGKTLLRRQTLLVRDGVVRSVRYPVFPPNEDAPAVLDWLRTQPA
jgi:peroxiredoxin